MQEFFVKRKGTTDLGKDYEDLVTTNLVLRLLTTDEISDFKLSSNDEKFGTFDDIVLEIIYNNNKEKYAVQLKHGNRNDKSLTLDSLGAEKGNFSVKKYFESFSTIKANCKPCQFLIFTNLRKDIRDYTKIPMKGENFDIQISKFTPNFLFYISSDNGYCYKFVPIERDSTVANPKRMDAYREFFDNFLLYTNQLNCTNLRKNLTDNLKKSFACDDSNIDKFIKLISEWSKREGRKEKLNRVWMQQALTLCLLDGYIKPLSFGEVNARSLLFQRAIFDYHVTVFKQESYDRVKQLWGDARRSFKDLEEMKKLIKKYQLTSSDINITNVDQLDDLLLSKLLWLMDKCPLIVTGSQIATVLQFFPTGKFVLLGSDWHINGVALFQNLSHLDTRSKIYRDITKQFTISLQDKEEVTLEDLISENEEIRSIVKTDNLLEMLDGAYHISDQKEPLPEPYISRLLGQNVVDLKYLEKQNDQTLNVLNTRSVIDKLNVVGLLPYTECINVTDYLTANKLKEVSRSFYNSQIYLTEKECSIQELEMICKKNKKAKKCHLFKFTNDHNLEWIRSIGNITDFEKFKLEKCHFTEEKLLWTRRPNNDLNIIIGDSGFGKTELIKNFKNNFFKKFWTVNLYPKDIVSLLSFMKEDSGCFEKYILDVKYKTLRNFDKEFLKLSMDKNHVVFLWDAVDEISKEQLVSVTDLILELQKKGFMQWVTSRSYLKKFLEKKFNVLSKTLAQFSQQEQEAYIKKRLGNATEEIRAKIKSTFILQQHLDILGIPLQIFMITELFRQNYQKYLILLDRGEDYIFTLVDLYFYFIEEKFNIYYKEKARLDFQNVEIEFITDCYTKKTKEMYEKLAMMTLLPEEVLNGINVTKGDFNLLQDGKDRVGLITGVIDQCPCFLHNSFAEYFTANYFVKHTEKLQHFEDVFFDSKYSNVRFFFDLLMAKDSLPHKAVLYNNYDLLKKQKIDLMFCEDDGGRNVLHLANSWGLRCPTLEIDYNNGVYIVENENSSSITGPESKNYSAMLDYLLEKCDISKRDRLFNLTPFSYAEKSECFLGKIKIWQKQNIMLDDLNNVDICNILYYSALLGYDFVLDMFKQAIPFVKTRKDNNSLLHLSVSNENYFFKLLENDTYRIKVNDKNKFEETPLFVACEHKHKKVVTILLEADAGIDIAENNGYTPLHSACFNGHVRIVEILLEAGAGFDIVENDGATSLHFASQNGHEKVVRSLLKAGAGIDIAMKYCGFTPLHLACQNGHEKVVTVLIKAGAGFDIVTNDSATPLHLASQNGHENVVTILSRAGAGIDIVTNNGFTPLHLACQNGHEKVVTVLIEAGAGFDIAQNDGATPLHLASQNGHEKVVRTLLEAGASLDIVENNGTTPLYLACQNGHEKVVKMLLKAGAGFDIAINNSATPLHSPSQYIKHKHKKVVAILSQALRLAFLKEHEHVTILLEARVGIDIARNDGFTPLHSACLSGHEKVVTNLLEAGAGIDIATNKGFTPLHFASKNGHEKVVAVLLKAGAGIDIAANNGFTPLSLASRNGHEKAVTILLEAGAGINVTETDGCTPLHLACFNGHEKVVRILLEAGAGIDIAANNGFTPLSLASQNGHEKVVNILLKWTSNNLKLKF